MPVLTQEMCFARTIFDLPLPPGQDRFGHLPTPGFEGPDFSRGLPGGMVTGGIELYITTWQEVNMPSPSSSIGLNLIFMGQLIQKEDTSVRYCLAGSHSLHKQLCKRSETRSVFRERSLRKTVSFEEQIMSKDKYLSIFSPQVEAIVFIILQIYI